MNISSWLVANCSNVCVHIFRIVYEHKYSIAHAARCVNWSACCGSLQRAATDKEVKVVWRKVNNLPANADLFNRSDIIINVYVNSRSFEQPWPQFLAMFDANADESIFANKPMLGNFHCWWISVYVFGLFTYLIYYTSHDIIPSMVLSSVRDCILRDLHNMLTDCTFRLYAYHFHAACLNECNFHPGIPLADRVVAPHT